MSEAKQSLFSKVELFFSARNLKNKDLLSKSDPYLLIQLEDSNQSYFEVARTSKRKNTLNPNWRETITLDFYFEMCQNILFQVYDEDEQHPDFLGEVYTTLGDLVAKGVSILPLNLGGQVVVRVDEYSNSRNAFLITLHGVKLDKKDTFGKSDPYLIIYKNLPGNQWVEVYKTEVIKSNLNPEWKFFEITEQELCNCDREKPIKIECFDWDKVGKHDLIGVVEVTIDQLITIENRFELISKKGKKAGIILVKNVQEKKMITFVDYIRAGTQLSFSVAIDFTGSNLDIKNRKSLHYLSKNRRNPYQKAIWEVGNILQAYNNQKAFAVYGFGGIPEGEEKVNHCFALNGNKQAPQVYGIEGILEIYQKTLLETRLSGPTYFKPVIEEVRQFARGFSSTEVYHVLLILTDGVIDDMSQVTQTIKSSIMEPLSIIIIGIGDEDFSQMEILDMDRVKSKSVFFPEPRVDNVQFVPFKKFGGDPVRLAAEVLKELPQQVTEFMEAINYHPVIPDQPKLRKIQIPED
jgi:hypothetical protein